MDKVTCAMFESYFSVQAIKAGRLTFGQKAELVELLLPKTNRQHSQLAPPALYTVSNRR